MSVKKSSKIKKSRKQLKSPGFTGWAIIFLSVFIVVFLVSMMMPQPDVSIESMPPETIRMQIKNGCGVNGAAESMARAFMQTASDAMFDIIDRGNAETFNFEKTLVVDRKGDPVNSDAYSKAALMVAGKLGAGEDQLVLQKLSDNLLDIDVTVIIGADFESVLKKLQSEENSR
jgi:hypothetical protein